jgi:hypothetical protein
MKNEDVLINASNSTSLTRFQFPYESHFYLLLSFPGIRNHYTEHIMQSNRFEYIYIYTIYYNLLLQYGLK